MARIVCCLICAMVFLLSGCGGEQTGFKSTAAVFGIKREVKKEEGASRKPSENKKPEVNKVEGDKSQEGTSKNTPVKSSESVSKPHRSGPSPESMFSVGIVRYVSYDLKWVEAEVKKGEPRIGDWAMIVASWPPSSVLSLQRKQDSIIAVGRVIGVSGSKVRIALDADFLTPYISPGQEVVIRWY